MKKSITWILALAVSLGIAFASEDFAEAKKLIEQKIPCSKLTEPQLEMLGDYYMELMHPGEIHEFMEMMMGGEGSESLKSAQIAMAKRFYCLNASVGYGMGMHRGTMHWTYDNNFPMVSYKPYPYGGMMKMMGYNGFGMMGYGYFGINSFLVTILLIGLVILVYLWIAKMWKEINARK